MRNKTYIQHWEYRKPTESIYETGWACQVYEALDFDIQYWMKNNMKGKYYCTRRFNSGNPVCYVIIKDDIDATFFKLTFL